MGVPYFPLTIPLQNKETPKAHLRGT